MDEREGLIRNTNNAPGRPSHSETPNFSAGARKRIETCLAPNGFAEKTCARRRACVPRTGLTGGGTPSRSTYCKTLGGQNWTAYFALPRNLKEAVFLGDFEPFAGTHDRDVGPGFATAGKLTAEV